MDELDRGPFTVYEVADIFGVHHSKVRRWILEGKLKADGERKRHDGRKMENTFSKEVILKLATKMFGDNNA